jgi:hypothetical protein
MLYKQKLIKGFTQKYNVCKLIYYEKFDSIESAIFREKQIKGYSRSKKDALINKINPQWDELLVKSKPIHIRFYSKEELKKMCMKISLLKEGKCIRHIYNTLHSVLY